MQTLNLRELIIRYAILIFLGVCISVFYTVFFPLTFYPVTWILDIFYTLSAFHNTLFFGTVTIEIIRACIAPSAYYLFVLLNLATPNISVKKRVILLLISFAAFLLLNILRIVLLAVLAINHSSWFSAAHLFFWYALSIVFVVGIWFALIKKYHIQNIPFYSDLKTLSTQARKNAR